MNIKYGEKKNWLKRNVNEYAAQNLTVSLSFCWILCLRFEFILQKFVGTVNTFIFFFFSLFWFPRIPRIILHESAYAICKNHIRKKRKQRVRITRAYSMDLEFLRKMCTIVITLIKSCLMRLMNLRSSWTGGCSECAPSHICMYSFFCIVCLVNWLWFNRNFFFFWFEITASCPNIGVSNRFPNK